MPATSPIPCPCTCGQVIFDLSERKTGEALHCTSCGRAFRYLGGDQIAPLSDTISRANPLPELKRQPVPEAREEYTSSPKRESKAEPKREVKVEPKRDAKRSAALIPSASRPKMPAAKKADGPPGGLMPMVGFIVAFNAVAFLAVSFLLPKQDDGLRHALWDNDFTVSGKALWPDLTALVLGHLFGFACWALYAYRVHQRERLERKS